MPQLIAQEYDRTKSWTTTFDNLAAQGYTWSDADEDAAYALLQAWGII
jgi:hypothetical protein